MQQEQIEVRKLKGYEIAKISRIEKTSKGWKVPSQSGHGFYIVESNGFEAKCNCPDHEVRQCKCKHLWAVEFIVTKQIDQEGNVTITQTVRKSYSQNWSAYTTAQTNEQILFVKLLADLCKNVEQPKYDFGRPLIPYSDMVFASALKVYSTFSLRRFCSLMVSAKEKGYIEKSCCYVTVSNFMRNPKITPILHELIKLSSLPLASVEEKFAVDSSGFSTSRFARYYSYKHGKDRKYKVWIKAHLISGTKTNIVTGAEISEDYDNDSPFFKPLVEKTNENFTIKEVSADKAYSSRDNHNLIDSYGRVPYIPFKSNATGRSDGSYTWKRMFHLFQFNREQFLEHYHLRSNSETVFHMIKAKFKDNLRSKDKTAQINEVLLKVLCHNLCCLIQEMHELGINPQLCLKSGGGVKKVDEKQD